MPLIVMRLPPSRRAATRRAQNQFPIARRVAIRRLGLAGHARPFSRCLECNAALQEVSPAAVVQRLPPAVRARHTHFSACAGCGRVYWEGSHWQRLHTRIDALLAQARAAPQDEATD